MRLTIKDLSNLLNVSEKTIRRWIKEGSMPAYKINGQYRFNRTEILEWSTSRRLNAAVEIFHEPDETQVLSLAEALTFGGIFYRISGSDKESALKSVVELLRLPDDADRDIFCNFCLPARTWPPPASVTESPCPMRATQSCCMCRNPW